MINPAQFQSVLGKVNDNQLMEMLKRPDKIPTQFVVAEINRRQAMRQGAKAQQVAMANRTPVMPQASQQMPPMGRPLPQKQQAPQPQGMYDGGLPLPKPTLGERNKNPLNIRPNSDFFGYAGQNDGYAVFDSDLAGLRAGAVLADSYANMGIDNVNDFIDRYAPVGDNSSASNANYKRHVADALDVGLADKIDFTDPDVKKRLMRAQITFENGRNNYSDDMIDEAITLAKDKENNPFGVTARRVSTVNPNSQTSSRPKIFDTIDQLAQSGDRASLQALATDPSVIDTYGKDAVLYARNALGRMTANKQPRSVMGDLDVQQGIAAGKRISDMEDRYGYNVDDLGNAPTFKRETNPAKLANQDQLSRVTRTTNATRPDNGLYSLNNPAYMQRLQDDAKRYDDRYGDSNDDLLGNTTKEKTLFDRAMDNIEKAKSRPGPGADPLNLAGKGGKGTGITKDTFPSNPYISMGADIPAKDENKTGYNSENDYGLGYYGDIGDTKPINPIIGAGNRKAEQFGERATYEATLKATGNNNAADALSSAVGDAANDKSGLGDMNLKQIGDLGFFKTEIGNLRDDQKKLLEAYNDGTAELITKRKELMDMMDTQRRTPQNMMFQALIDFGLELAASPEANFMRAVAKAGQKGISSFRNLGKQDQEQLFQKYKMAYDIAATEFEHKMKGQKMALDMNVQLLNVADTLSQVGLRSSQAAYYDRSDGKGSKGTLKPSTSTYNAVLGMFKDRLADPTSRLDLAVELGLIKQDEAENMQDYPSTALMPILSQLALQQATIAGGLTGSNTEEPASIGDILNQ